MPSRRRLAALIPLLLILASWAGPAFAQSPFSLDEVLGYPFAYELVAAKKGGTGRLDPL